MITASIVTFYTNLIDLKRVFNCVLQSPISKLYIVDNSSENSIKEFVEQYPIVEYIANINNGYGAGHNIAIKKAINNKAKYHIVLNPDIYWTENIIEQLKNYMNQNSDVGQIMPKVFYPDGRLQYLCKMVPTPIDLIFKRFLPTKLARKRLYKFQLRFSGYDKIMNVPYLSGCFMFFRVSALKEVGLFDERFFMYPEDIDITRRMHAKYKTIFYPYVSIIHAHAAASKTSKKMLKIHIVNMIKYFNKWGWVFDKQRQEFNRNLLKELNYRE